MSSDIYISSSETGLIPVPGHVFAIEDFDLNIEASGTKQPDASLAQTNLILPETPAGSIKSAQKSSHATAVLRKRFSMPLLKADPTSGPPLLGRHSGIRSSILQNGGKLIRLKGCGNMYEKFKIIPVTDTPGGVQIRGCMFENTCLRELLMTQKIANMLEEHNIQWANKPLGWFEYESQPTDQFPNVKRMCAIYETHGDLRLSDHLLFGVEQLIPTWFNDSDTALIMELFSSLERLESPEAPVPTWTAALSDMKLLSLPLITTERSRPQHALLFRLMYRLGFEVGRFLTLLHQKSHISWGSYDDKLGFHCNAHPNNLIILSQAHATSSSLLAPLDFDLAFQRDEFTGHSERWQELLSLEVQAMRLALGGLNEINSGVADVAHLETKFQPVRWALRDLILSGYTHGIEGAQSDVVFSVVELDQAHGLIQQALGQFLV